MVNKIFEIGLFKTGTSSLGKAFEILGYKHMGWNKDAYDRFIYNNNYEDLFEIINNYDTFEDGPWHDCDYKILDQRYPNSKFILLERDNNDWVKSVEQHVSPIYNSNNIEDKYLEYGWIYNKEKQKEKMIKLKTNKYNEIREYFKNRSQDLLVMDIKEGWIPLCKFLNKDIPNISFPILNISKKKDEINKIFDIGIYTGDSMSIIYNMLGFKHKSGCEYINKLYKDGNNKDLIYQIINQYESFDGDPWRDMDIELLDKLYPNSKFIYSYVDDYKWINKLELIFSPKYNINNFEEKYLNNDWVNKREECIKNLIDYKNNKLKKIVEYFKNRDNILYYNLDSKWGPLCKFLNFNEINVKFQIT